LPNPVDTNLFRPIDFAKKQKEILYVGRLQYNKGVFDLIDAIKPVLNDHADWIVRLIGKNLKIPNFLKNSHTMASEEILARIPTKNHNQIKIMGWVSIDELIRYQQQAMIAVVPSRGFESFSYTLTEQMASGTAVIATHCGGPTEIINDGYDGMLVPVGDIEAMRNAIQKLIMDTELCREMSRRARKTVEHKYSISKVVPAITDWYGKIIERYKK
jgi:glycosyltransferase involved in cell wall biosynthesis